MFTTQRTRGSTVAVQLRRPVKVRRERSVTTCASRIRAASRVSSTIPLASVCEENGTCSTAQRT